MDKLILIDGNSLLNRAFYAMRLFTTKDGLPTNGVFGFVKLILKIIEDEKPSHFAVTFDLHAPTFRHKMYDGYKATRKPMHEELRVQVPLLKDLLRAMNIRIVEKEGYEADDLLGTLSRMFNNVQVLIYTGDRDSYQLVKENVEIRFTRRGVSDLDALTVKNFTEKTGLAPYQIIEEKALMGDSSDNIPGVKGIGPKSALELLQKYGSVDNIYEHISDISATTQKKLMECKELCYLSRTLATIDTAVPLDVTLESCRLKVPFSGEAREACLKLEFRSLIDGKYFESAPKTVDIQSVTVNNTTELEACLSQLDSKNTFAYCEEKDGVHVAAENVEYLFPLKATLLDNGFYPQELLPLYKKLFEGEKPVLVTDLKALLHFADNTGFSVTAPVEDIALLCYLDDSNRKPESAKELAKQYSISEETCASALFYALKEAQERTDGSAEQSLYRTLELPLVTVLYDMEKTGVRVATNKFNEFSEKFKKELSELSEKIYALAGGSFNLNSPFQLSEILFEKLGYSPQGAKKNIRGGYSTSSEVLEKLAEEHEIARLILRYREVQKLQSTYIDGIRPLVVGDIVHTTYQQMSTTTGRLSSTNPNLQNIPVRTEYGKELRKLFIAREGNILVDADYSQIELRLLAHFSGCKPLVEAYNKEADIHAITASEVFGVPLSNVTKQMRRRAKAVNFGIIYGISAFGLAKDLDIPAKEAQAYIDKYFETYSDVKEYMEENVARAKRDGYVTTILGRKRAIPELKASNYNLRMFGERAAMNMPLQGSAADIIKLAMLGVFNRLKSERLSAKLVLQVHDELVIDTPLEEAEKVKILLKEEMEHAVALKVPLTTEVSTGKSWYDAK